MADDNEHKKKLDEAQAQLRAQMNKIADSILTTIGKADEDMFRKHFGDDGITKKELIQFIDNPPSSEDPQINSEVNSILRTIQASSLSETISATMRGGHLDAKPPTAHDAWNEFVNMPHGAVITPEEYGAIQDKMMGLVKSLKTLDFGDELNQKATGSVKEAYEKAVTTNAPTESSKAHFNSTNFLQGVLNLNDGKVENDSYTLHKTQEELAEMGYGKNYVSTEASYALLKAVHEAVKGDGKISGDEIAKIREANGNAIKDSSLIPLGQKDIRGTDFDKGDQQAMIQEIQKLIDAGVQQTANASTPPQGQPSGQGVSQGK